MDHSQDKSKEKNEIIIIGNNNIIKSENENDSNVKIKSEHSGSTKKTWQRTGWKGESEVKKKLAIKSYRQRKNLCLLCGKLPHYGPCEENYIKSDMRSKEEIERDRRIIVTPKARFPTITDTMINEKAKEEFLKITKNPLLKMSKTEPVPFVKKYIIIDIRSCNNHRLDFSYIKFMSKRYPTINIFLLGNIKESFIAKDLLIFKKLLNLKTVPNLVNQYIVNLLHGCERFFGFPSDYALYCILNDIKCTIFLNNEDDYTLPCDIIKLDKEQNVDIELVKSNVLTWRI